MAAPLPVVIHIPAGSLGQAISSVARQARISVGYVGRLPKVQVAPAKVGSAHEALALIARQAGFLLIQIDARHFRLEQSARPLPLASSPIVTPVTDAAPEQEIVVTGTKRAAALLDVPLSVSILTKEALPHANSLAGTSDVVASVSSLTSTNMGPGRNRIFIRGVADSAFNGPTQSTVGIFLGEARVNFDTPDPDLRLIDIERVEVLKGPQGALYGSGVLGGVYHIVPQPPERGEAYGQVSSQIGTTAHGGVNASVSGVANVPISDKIATRLVAYRDEMSGWIDDRFRQVRNVNAVHISGGRLSTRWTAGGLVADALLAGQWTRARDSQYATQDEGPYARSTRFAEPHRTAFLSGQLKLSVPLGGAQASLSSAYVQHDLANRFDASRAAMRLGEASPLLYDEGRGQNLVTNEARLAKQGGAFQWLLGVGQLVAKSSLNASLVSEVRQTSISTYHKSYQEQAAFGDASLAVTPALRLQAGLRVFRATNEERRRDGEDAELAANWRVNPGAALSWKPSAATQVWLNYATATRPGGLNPLAQEEPYTFAADRLSSLEAGMRLTRLDGRLRVQASAFRFNWANIQSDILLSSGLIGTLNVGRAHNFGAEVELGWRAPSWRAVLSATSQFGDVYSTSPLLGVIEDARLPTVPRLRGYARLEADLPSHFGQSKAGLTVQASGPSHLSFDPRLDRKTNSYALVGVFLQTQWRHLTFGIAGDNVLNSAADSFAFGNPFSVDATHQLTPVRPRTLTLSVERRF